MTIARVLATATGVGLLCIATAGCTPRQRQNTSASERAPQASPPQRPPPETDPSAKDPTAKVETAYLAGGCFWGMEDILRTVPGVIDTEVGYMGGTTRRPDYDDVHSGESGHAESVRIEFDPKKLSYETLLEKWFFRMHDPTTKNRQGNDIGSQYRSAIFVTSAEQRRVAESVKERVDRSGKWSAPVVTEIVQAGPFTPAEGYHQDYLVKNPRGYTCHYLRD